MTDRDPRVPTSDSEVPAPPRRYPAWTDPPLPGGPTDPTPPGSATWPSRGGGTSAQLVKQGHRVPILYGRRTFAPDIVYASVADNTLHCNRLAILNIPTSAAGLASGMIWSDGGTLKIVP